MMVDGGTKKRRPCRRMERPRHASRAKAVRRAGWESGNRDDVHRRNCAHVVLRVAGYGDSDRRESRDCGRGVGSRRCCGARQTAPTYTFDGETIHWYVLLQSFSGLTNRSCKNGKKASSTCTGFGNESINIHSVRFEGRIDSRRSSRATEKTSTRLFDIRSR